MPTTVELFSTAELTAMLDAFWGILTGNIGPILVVFGVMFGVSFAFRKLGAARNARV